MKVRHVDLLVEEPSMEAGLRLLLPRLVGSLSFEVYTHQCKDELLARLPGRLRGYASWIPEGWRIVVVVDQDDDDCTALKHKLEKMAADAGLPTRSTMKGRGPYVVANRLAIEELEAWYFGDWEAVRKAYPRVPLNIPAQAKYRNPDAIKGGTWEAFERVLQKAGYYSTGLRKLEAARAVAAHIEPSRSTSSSFRSLRDVLSEIAGK